MGDVTRHIGLSLGADICWPLCFEHMIRRLDLRIPVGGDTVRFEVERVTIEPFDLQQPCRYDVVLDRLTHWYHPTREWLKKSILMDGLYTLNNPWSIQANEKHTSYCAMMALGMPIPDTWMVPPKDYEPLPDLAPTLKRYAKLFDLRAIGQQLGYPLFMKPYDGGGWRAVSRCADESQLKARYEESGKSVMHLQAAVHPFDSFVRCIGLGPQTHLVKYDPDAALHDRYTQATDFVSADEAEILRDTTLTINAFFGWDFNSCEALRKGGDWFPIDFANPCPDSQVTSLHYHFPWMVKAYLKWAIFTSTTKRPMRKTLDFLLHDWLGVASLLERPRFRPFLWLLFFAFPFPYIATTAGWMTAELGRQPWLVFGVMRTADGSSLRVHAGSVLFTLFGFLGLYFVMGLLFVVLRTKLTVGADGVLRTWFWRKSFWSWAEVKQIQTYVDSSFWSSNNRWRGVELVLRSGASVRFPIVQGRSLDTGQMTLILERMRQAKESHDRGDAASEAALLERHERDIPAWIAALRAIGSGANQDHRTAPVVPEKLWRIVEDPAATAAARAGAAVALSTAIDAGGKKRLAAAAEAVAAPKLRIALDAAAKGDEEALREALSEVEAGERVKRA